jgi:hypothetical protein
MTSVVTATPYEYWSNCKAEGSLSLTWKGMIVVRVYLSIKRVETSNNLHSHAHHFGRQTIVTEDSSKAKV